MLIVGDSFQGTWVSCSAGGWRPVNYLQRVAQFAVIAALVGKAPAILVGLLQHPEWGAQELAAAGLKSEVPTSGNFCYLPKFLEHALQGILFFGGRAMQLVVSDGFDQAFWCWLLTPPFPQMLGVAGEVAERLAEWGYTLVIFRAFVSTHDYVFWWVWRSQQYLVLFVFQLGGADGL